jgi:hypothetical protein
VRPAPAAYVPAAHFAHSAAPVDAWNDPASQIEQPVAPLAGW